MLRISVETPRAHHRAASQGEASAACQQVRSELSVVTVSLQLLNINKIWKSTSVDSERTVSGESKGGKEHLTFQRGYLLTPLITNVAEVDFMGHEQPTGRYASQKSLHDCRRIHEASNVSRLTSTCLPNENIITSLWTSFECLAWLICTVSGGKR